MNRYNFLVILFVIIVIGLAFVGYRAILQLSSKPQNPSAIASTNSGGSVLGTSTSTVKEFTIHASDFQYDVSNITVNKGDTVQINLVVDQGIHAIKIDEFNVDSNIRTVGESDSVQFVADKSGTFQFYDPVSTHRDMGMVGTLTVR